MKKELVDALVAMARETDQGENEVASTVERRASLDPQTSLTAFRNLVDGALLCTLSSPLTTLNEEESATVQEGLLRLTAETRFGDPLYGSLDPEDCASLTVDVPRALLDEPVELERILDSVLVSLDGLHVPAHEAPAAAAPVSEEAKWIPV